MLAPLHSYTSTGGGLVIGAAIDNAAQFTGGAGADSVILGATAKTVDMGAGNDTVTLGASLATGGSVLGGDGVDILKVTNAIATANDAGSTFNAAVNWLRNTALY